jgi:hypothetical protein
MRTEEEIRRRLASIDDDKCGCDNCKGAISALKWVLKEKARRG